MKTVRIEEYYATIATAWAIGVCCGVAGLIAFWPSVLR